jgi:YXWGXW repeat-containing protein
MRAPLAVVVLAGAFATQSMVSAEVIIRTAPPAPVSVAIVGRPPSSLYVWIPGYYRGAGGRYVWVAGRWMKPPHRGMVWIPPVWRKGPSGYVFVAGRWR